MTPWLQIIFLAILQGITEFIPISSSGHLVLAKSLLGIESAGIVLELTLHAGSLLSILVFFRRRVIDLTRSFFMADGEGRKLAAIIVLATMPAVGVGFFFKDALTRLFENPLAVALLLCLTGLILLSSQIPVRTAPRSLTWRNGLVVGLMQALAILPGISRSGITITAGRRLGLSPAAAAEFSFLLAIPVLVGSSLLMLRELGAAQVAGWTPAMLSVGMLISAIVGYAALAILLRLLAGGRFWWFGLYCLGAGSLMLGWFIR